MKLFDESVLASEGVAAGSFPPPYKLSTIGCMLIIPLIGQEMTLYQLHDHVGGNYPYGELKVKTVVAALSVLERNKLVSSRMTPPHIPGQQKKLFICTEHGRHSIGTMICFLRFLFDKETSFDDLTNLFKSGLSGDNV